MTCYYVQLMSYVVALKEGARICEESYGQRKVSIAMPSCLANIQREFMLRQSKRNLEVDFDRSKFNTRVSTGRWKDKNSIHILCALTIIVVTR